MVIARNSNLLGKITILIMFNFCVNTSMALDGSGTQEDPWRIKSLADFNDFAADANYWDDYTRLETDVNLAGQIYSTAVIAMDINSAEYYFQGTSFTGVFDGNEHKIMNLTIDDHCAGNWYLGLFGRIDEGEVKNLGLASVYVTGFECVGGLVGSNAFLSVVSNCYSTGSVSGESAAGGLVGENWGFDTVVSNCYSNGSVSGRWEVGGLVGANGGSISNCCSTGDVNGVNYVGGLVGWNVSSVSNCYSTGEVSGESEVGGLVGTNSRYYDIQSGIIHNCYSTGDVSGDDDIGGLVGVNLEESDISDCFWDTSTQTHGVTESIGQNDGTAMNVEGLPTVQMQTLSTFAEANWDFINVWNIGENQTYPYLRVYLPSDINKDGIVNFLDVAITANQWIQEQ